MANEDYSQLFDDQVETLLQKAYPKAAGMSEKDFLELITPLKSKLAELPAYAFDMELGTLPFVLVVSHTFVPTELAMSKLLKDGKEGITKLFPHTPADFATITEERIPDSNIYLLLDIDRGKESLNVAPDKAMEMIRQANRHPLTIDEGVAIVTQYPEFLQKNNCFSLLASRHEGDKRVPAIWINGKKHPNLGWCWNGNPHTWLGSASCGSRVGLS